jgi:hypothetical protein
VNKKTLVLLMVLGGALGVWKVVQERHAQSHPVLATSEDLIGYATGQAVSDAAQYDNITMEYIIP